MRTRRTTTMGRTSRRLAAMVTAAALALGMAGVAGSTSVQPAAAAEVTEVVATTTHASYTETGTWSEARDPGYEGGRTRFTREAGATATWTLELPETGEYIVDVWYAASVNNDKVMTYSWTPGQDEPVEFDQSVGGGGWRNVGLVEGEAGTTVELTVTAVTEGAITRTDAVRLRSNQPACEADVATPAVSGPSERTFDGYRLVENTTEVTVETDAWALSIERAGFRYGLRSGMNVVAEPHPTSGLQVSVGDSEPCDAATTEVVAADETEVRLDVVFTDGRHADVTIVPSASSVNLQVTPVDGESGRIEAQVGGGLSPAYGLGDLGGLRSNLNVYGIDEDDVAGQRAPETTNLRFVSTFTVFPNRDLAQVVFDRGVKSVQVDADATSLGVVGSSMPGLHYFFGDMHTVYEEYKRVRSDEGYVDAKPDRDFFGVGYESYGALGYNTNQATITESVGEYLDRGYPLKWAVTGSGFWPHGDGNEGTTTGFGIWGERYPDPDAYKRFFAENDVRLILGLRQNFKALPDHGGLYDPQLDGPSTVEGLERGYYLTGDDGEPRTFQPISFPRSRIYLLDPDNAEGVDWFVDKAALWGVDGFKEDHMFDSTANGYVDDAKVNPVNEALAAAGNLIMVRNSAYSVPGSILRINDTDYNHSTRDRDRTAVNGLAYGASGQANFYPDIVGGRIMPDLETNTAKQRYVARNAMFAAMSPSMSFGNEPWRISDPELSAATLKAAQWHDTYLPYIYSAAVQSWQTGYPVTATPLPIAYPDDPATYDLVSYDAKQYEWMLGPSLLVHPLYGSDVTTAETRDVYLPAGEWMDIETGGRFTGPTTLEDYPHPVGAIPAFVGGAGVLTSQRGDDVVAEVYPVAPQGSSYTFTGADGSTTSTITTDNARWDAVRVVDATTGAEVGVEADDVTGAISFPIVEGHDYRVTVDACPAGYAADTTVAFGDADSGVPNYDRGDGCTFLDVVWAGGPFDDHGAFIRTVRETAVSWLADGLLTRAESQAILRAAASSAIARSGS